MPCSSCGPTMRGRAASLPCWPCSTRRWGPKWGGDWSWPAFSARPALRRRAHHSGNFRHFGPGRSGSGHHPSPTFRLAYNLPGPGFPFPGPKSWNWAHGKLIRSGDDSLVCGHRLARPQAIAARPEILAAVNPLHGLQFFLHNGLHGFFILGAWCCALPGAKPFIWTWGILG